MGWFPPTVSLVSLIGQRQSKQSRMTLTQDLSPRRARNIETEEVLGSQTAQTQQMVDLATPLEVRLN
jgi:hypothetical protein